MLEGVAVSDGPRRVRNNAIALGIVQLFNYVVPLAVMLRLTDVLGSERYGLVAFSIGIGSLALVIGDLGFTLSATERISRRRHRRAYVAEFAGAVLCLKFAFAVVLSLGVLAFAFLTDSYSQHRPMLLLTILPILAQSLLPTWLFQGIERMQWITIFVVISRLSFFASVWLLVTSPAHYAMVPALNGMSLALAVVAAFWLLSRTGYKVRSPRLVYCRHAFRLTLPFFASRVAVALYMNSGAVVLGAFAPGATVGIYAVAEQGYRVLQNAVAPLVTASYPYMAKRSDLRLLTMIAVGTTTAALFVCALAHITAPALIQFFFGAEWQAVPALFDLFLVALPVHVLTVFAGYPLAAALGRLEVANSSVCAGPLCSWPAWFSEHGMTC